MKLDLDLSDFIPKPDYILTYTQAKCLRQYIRNAIESLEFIGKDKTVTSRYNLQSSLDILSELDRIEYN